MYMTPSELFRDHGCVPGKLLVDDNDKLVLGGDVYSIFSFGSLTKVASLGEVITQLFKADFSMQ
jgi:hypothetical protein